MTERTRQAVEAGIRAIGQDIERLKQELDKRKARKQELEGRGRDGK